MNAAPNRALARATLSGTILQLLMVIVGHFSPLVRDRLFAILGMLISAWAGWLVAQRGGRPTRMGSVSGGALAGGVCAFVGIAFSVLMGDTPAPVLGYGTLASIVTGAIGGAIGHRSTTSAAT